MKKMLLVSATTLFFAGVNAQNAIPNPGFESWTSQGSYDDCAGWGTIDQAVSSACFCKGTAVKTNVAGEVHSGVLAMKLKTISVFGQTAPGIAATGTINQSTAAVDGGVAFNLRPDSIVGWYRYSPSGADTGSVDITLSKWNGASRDVVGHARFFKTTSVASYARFTLPLIYSLPGAPDTMVVILMSSSGGSPVVNSTMFVDDLDLIYNTTTGIANNISSSSASVYPNPNNGTFNIRMSDYENANVEIYNAVGQKVVEQTLQNNLTQLDLTNFSHGFYFVRVTKNNTLIYQSKIVKE